MSADDDVVMRVTVRDLWLSLEGFKAEVRTAFSQLGLDSAGLTASDAMATKVHEDHEKRLRALEVWRWKAAGAVGLVVSTLGCSGYWVLQVHH